MPVECVVFDIDDTLYLERDYVRSGFRAVGGWVGERFGIAGFGETCWGLFEAGVRRSTFDRALQTHGLTAKRELVQELVELYRHHRPEIAMLPDVTGFIAAKAAPVLAAITDGPRIAQRQKIRALNLEAWVSPILVTDELGPGAGKPSPTAFTRIETESGFRGASCCYVADNPLKDFIAPRALGWRTVRVRREGGLHSAIPSSVDIDAEITTFDDLTGAVFPQETAP